MKLDAPSEPASSVSDDEESLDTFADAEGDEEVDLSFGDEKEDNVGNEKPFDDEPFDAGVEADEDEDPEKFIQQLAGKLGTSLRKYNDERGEPDFDLEKYAINSVISATHTAEMEEEDQKDIIKKVKMSGAGDENDDIDKDLDMDSEEPKDEEPMGDDLGFGDDEDIEEGYYEESWADPMELKEGVEVSDNLKYHLDNKIALGESIFRYGSNKYVELYTEVKDLHEKGLISINENDEILLEDFTNQSIIIEGETILLNLIIENSGERIIEEGDRYKGQKTNSPTRGAGGGKAYKVFVPGCAVKTKSNPRGIKKISFGSGGLKAKLSNKDAKKSYNARHGCSKGRHNDKCKAGYWSCRLPRYAKKLGLSGGGTWW